jgi:hypothetical protein
MSGIVRPADPARSRYVTKEGTRCHRESTGWTFGAAPLDLNHDRFLRSFVFAVVIALIPQAVAGRSAR